jgi:propanol-preferring alcohol dehydrogenase
VKVSGLRPAETAAVFGSGGLGHLALQYARVFGAETVAVDVDDAKLDLARDLGAAHTIHARRQGPVEAIQALGGVDVAITVAADPRVLEHAHAALRRGERFVLVALPRDNAMRLPILEIVCKGIRVIGSLIGTRADLAEVFRLHAAGRTRVIYQVRPLADVNACVEEVLAGRVPTRLVFRVAR